MVTPLVGLVRTGQFLFAFVFVFLRQEVSRSWRQHAHPGDNFSWTGVRATVGWTGARTGQSDVLSNLRQRDNWDQTLAQVASLMKFASGH